ncbi:MAG: indole-3-glycerol phosphate synthase TrpC [Bacteroidota bacterium]
MATILDDILADTKTLVTHRKREFPRSSLLAMEHYEHERLDFAAALRGDDLRFIAEVKKASPSKGVIREDFHPTDIAQRYADGGAAAISVLTEPKYFQGSLGYLEAIRRVVEVPLLRKDFILDPHQIEEARAYGADAVLLIAAALERPHLIDLLDAAKDIGVACLVELYDAHEIEKIDFDRVAVLGVNNRDLRTFTVDIDHSLRVFEQIAERTDADVVRVSESGLRSPDDLAYLRRNGIDAVLIGETFMRAPNPGVALADARLAVAQRLATDETLAS